MRHKHGSRGNVAPVEIQFLSLLDPILTSDGAVTLDSYTGASLQIVAGGKITINGDVQITGIDPALDVVNSVLILQAGVPGTTNNVPFNPSYDYSDFVGPKRIMYLLILATITAILLVQMVFSLVVILPELIPHLLAQLQ